MPISAGLGQISGGPIVGIIGAHFSLRIALVVVGIIMSPGLLILARAFGLKPPRAPASDAPTIRETPSSAPVV